MPKVTEGEVVVLEEYVVHADFVKFAQEQGWIKETIQEGDGDKISFQEIWVTPDRKSAINYVEDPLTLTRHLWIRGSKQKALLGEVFLSLPAYGDEELLDKAIEAKDHDEAVEAILRLGAGFPRFDPNALHIFEAYLGSPSPLLRKATIQAIAYRLWTETAPLLEKVAQDDPDEDVKKFAQQILRYLTDP